MCMRHCYEYTVVTLILEDFFDLSTHIPQKCLTSTSVIVRLLQYDEVTLKICVEVASTKPQQNAKVKREPYACFFFNMMYIITLTSNERKGVSNHDNSKLFFSV